MKLTIDRARWHTGRYRAHTQWPGYSMLLNAHDMQCCLGFEGAACGVSSSNLSGTSYPRNGDKGWPAVLFERSPHKVSEDKGAAYFLWATVFAVLNDEKGIDDKTREEWIAAGFRIVQGIEVEFVGEYPEKEAGS